MLYQPPYSWVLEWNHRYIDDVCRLETIWGVKKTNGNGECSEGKAGGRKVYVLKVYYIPALKSPSVSLCNNRKGLKIDFKKLGHF